MPVGAMKTALLLPLAALVAGCAAEETDTTFDAVAPLLAQHCTGCHTDGGIAPFALTSYDAAAAQAGVMRDAVASRSMPPWGTDNSGACGSYRDARWLSDEEIATFARWA